MADVPDTLTITTPLLGKTVVIRAYTTARVRQAIQGILLRGQQFDASKGGEAMKAQLQEGKLSISGEALEEVTNKTLEHMVMSVDGQTESVLDRLLNLPEDDFDFVVAEVEKVKGPLAKTK